METDCILSHGMAYYMKDKHVECSDKFSTHVCDECGLIAVVNPEKNIAECKKCNNKSNFSEISLPYASKLLFYEVGAMGMSAKFHTK